MTDTQQANEQSILLYWHETLFLESIIHGLGVNNLLILAKIY